MRTKFFPLLLITLFAMLLMVNSFHRHADVASMVKCPLCSGMYVSADTHTNINVPLIIQSEIIFLLSRPRSYPLILNPVPRSLRDRAPPSFLT